MTSKIKWGLSLAGIIVLALGVLYVRSLQAQNLSLKKEVAIISATTVALQHNLSRIVSGSAIVAAKSEQAGRDIASLNKEIDNVRISHEAPDVDLAVANTVAEQLNRLFQ